MADAFDPRPDGTVFLQWDGSTPGSTHSQTLRRPSLAEYKALVARLGELASTIDAASPGSGVAATEAWVAEVFATLSDVKLPPATELPSWLLNGDLSRDLIVHWQAIPARAVGPVPAGMSPLATLGALS